MKVDTRQDIRYLLAAEEVLAAKFEILPRWLSVVEEDGRLLAVFIFHGASDCDCEISVATFGPRPFTRAILRELFYYPFETCGFRRVSAKVRETNARSLNCTSRLGFQVEGLLRNQYPDCNGILFGMLKEECKWLK